MTHITQSEHWKILQAQQKELDGIHMRDLFVDDPERFTHFSIQTDPLTLDYSKNRITANVRQSLIDLARQVGVGEQIDRLFSGERVNESENQPALHTSLRDFSLAVPDCVKATRMRMQQIVTTLHGITDVIHVGVGGSLWGPQLVYDALAKYRKKIRVHFVGTHDREFLLATIKPLNPATTLVIFVSKTFTTNELLYNLSYLKMWAKPDNLFAVTACSERACALGIAKANILPIWPWVGGRYSLWSAVGLSVAIAIGWSEFENLLRGAQAMDRHVKQAELQDNIPVMLALLSIWYQNFWWALSHTMIGYHSRLQYLVPHLQQLHMESLGKCVQQNGLPLEAQSAAVIWGGVGTGSQHTFAQALLQNNALIPVDFILPVASVDKFMLANCLGSSQALMQGYAYDEVMDDLLRSGMSILAAKSLAPHKVIPGNQPSNTLLLAKLDAYHLGALLATYEHKVFVQSVMLNINAFDQCGVERGKVLAKQFLSNLEQDNKLENGAQLNKDLLMTVELMCEANQEKIF